MKCVFAFDRDDTVTNPEKPGPIPVSWVRRLARETEHEVWAIGNQKLKEEAGVPGRDEMVERYRERCGDPADHFDRRTDPKIEVCEGLPADAPDPDIVTAVYLREGGRAPRGWSSGEPLERHQRVRLLGSLFPGYDKHIVVDNKYLDFIAGWSHYFPEEFATLVETVDALVEDGSEPA